MNLDLRFEMADILPLLPIPQPPYGKTAYNIPCPYCDRAEGRGRHLNINLKKNVFCCHKCGSFSGGVFDLYSYYEGVPRDKVYKHLKTRLEGGDPGESHRDKRQDQRKRIAPPPAVPQAPLADISTPGTGSIALCWRSCPWHRITMPIYWDAALITAPSLGSSTGQHRQVVFTR